MPSHAFADSPLASELKVTTWNLEWFTNKAPHHALLGENVKPKSETAITHLMATRKKLLSQIFAFQEADDTPLLARLFPPSEYQIFLSQELQPIAQHVGIAVTKTLPVIHHADLPLALIRQDIPHSLRNGVDISVKFHEIWIRILAVHLKSGCWDAPYPSPAHSCPLLRQQVSILSQWVQDRLTQHQPFILLGDFNRRLTVHDEFFTQLDPTHTLLLLTANQASPCQGGQYFIDHIILASAETIQPIPHSFKVGLYSNEGEPPAFSPPSDHCPVSVSIKLAVPSPS
ncbi:hypothetical protein JGUZn3_23680 [Entomobacter blattae]|uniref:Endonuclease/exonuclease/phosphatase domain-containing protein n=1 Tax=Entomobacter blattae TaxID=2762277 RepID=A0A7H1NUV8_9PROT|nr:hypothetical protein JGUZn3_23680 [Entomobacter blattae]